MLRLIQCGLEFCDRSRYNEVGGECRGIYVLYQENLENNGPKSKQYDVVYVGMTDSSIRRRLRTHAKSKRKSGWTHFSAYAVWPNITKEEIQELEGLFRHLYRHDSRANVFNLQRRYKALQGITTKNLAQWREWTESIRNLKPKVKE
jgi:hypothetical protein